MGRHLQAYLRTAVPENYTPTAVLLVIQCHVTFAQATTRKTRILDVVYNASNNELVSTSSAGSHTLGSNIILRLALLPSVTAAKQSDCHLLHAV